MKYKLLLFAFLIALAGSALLSFIPVSTICDAESGAAGCSVVTGSIYSKTFGISNSHLGLVAFLALFVITISHMVKPRKEKEMIILSGITITAAFAGYFIYLQFFVLKALCTYCLIVDLSSIAALVIVLIYGRD